jgi:hypothetical protein
MNRYLVESSHLAKDCYHVIEMFVYHGHINNFDWGCEAGVHSGWAIVEADSESMALLSVPAILRPKSRAIKISKFTPEMMQSSHEKIE